MHTTVPCSSPRSRNRRRHGRPAGRFRLQQRGRLTAISRQDRKRTRRPGKHSDQLRRRQPGRDHDGRAHAPTAYSHPVGLQRRWRPTSIATMTPVGSRARRTPKEHTTYTYDNANQLTGVTENSTSVETYSYDSTATAPGRDTPPAPTTSRPPRPATLIRMITPAT